MPIENPQPGMLIKRKLGQAIGTIPANTIVEIEEVLGPFPGTLYREIRIVGHSNSNTGFSAQYFNLIANPTPPIVNEITW